MVITGCMTQAAGVCLMGAIITLPILTHRQAPEQDIHHTALTILPREHRLPLMVILSEVPALIILLTLTARPVIMAQPLHLTLPLLLPAQFPAQGLNLSAPDSVLQATIGCLIPVAGACLMDQPMCQADYLIPTILLT